MKAIVYHTYGPPELLRLEDVEKPVPQDNEVLIKVRTASLNTLDWRMLEGKPFLARLIVGGLRKPKRGRPGIDVAGEVEAIGKNVTQFKPGDEVFGVCKGACAEYACATENKLALKPPGISFAEAAAVPVAAVTALQGLRDKGHIRPGQKVLIDGASGGVGTFAIQLAKSFGAEVTAVCSTPKLDTARSLGADHVIDYTQEDFTRKGQGYDLIMAANAFHSVFDYKRALSPQGVYVMAGAGETQTMIQTMLLAPVLSMIGSKKVCFIVARVTPKDLVYLGELLAARKVVSVIDRTYALADTAEAFRYIQTKHARGKVIITIDDPEVSV
jgi:NADPH:quinone reductase-like Zn-dependent oxidoreductase